ncbi:MAG TPA: peptidase inhibitor family I36 protein [Streptomyces sp.]|nr:peptidase inhibitor family I36 protein [Streptomyces sp.]
MRKRTIGILASAGALAATVGLSGTASAEPNPPNCPKGYFCMYSGPNQTGELRLRTAGNWSGSLNRVGSVFNNGVVYPGADHIQFAFTDNGTPVSFCIHYNPGPGSYKWNAPDGAVTAKSATWRGEC